jgi:hypothetical protein
MKQFKSIFTTIFMIMFVSLCTIAFTSCGDDDKDEPTPYLTQQELVGTVWTGQNATQDNYEIKIVNASDLTLNIVSKTGSVYVDKEMLKYTYTENDGKFNSDYNGAPIAGQITKTNMTFKISGETITLKKK